MVASDKTQNGVNLHEKIQNLQRKIKEMQVKIALMKQQLNERMIEAAKKR